jgi:cellulose synthase/poly-beta-1,6-N-acetylglucosamine synthase-like glycosyltransferase
LPNNKEIIVVSDEDCPGFPAVKRNWAMERTIGKYLAFIDSDAYPSYDWITNALILMQAGFAGICGPGVLPPGSSLLEQATDLVYSILPYSYRVRPAKQRIVAEFPTFNLIVRRDCAPKFKNYLTGEDTLFCREINGLILYDPKVLVYHHRRPLFKSLWKQVSTYGKHRGHLIRLAILGLVTTVVVYGYNFIKGILRKEI